MPRTETPPPELCMRDMPKMAADSGREELAKAGHSKAETRFPVAVIEDNSTGMCALIYVTRVSFATDNPDREQSE